MDEKRKFTRVRFIIKALVDYQGKHLTGEVADLSLRGLFIKMPDPIPAGQPVSVILRLSSNSSDLKVCLTGKVARVAPDGIGIAVEHMDLDSFIHLRGIVAYNSGDEERVDSEFMTFIKERK